MERGAVSCVPPRCWTRSPTLDADRPAVTFDAAEIDRVNELLRMGELTRSVRERRENPGQLPRYPPVKQEDAVVLVMQQAEHFATEVAA